VRGGGSPGVQSDENHLKIPNLPFANDFLSLFLSQNDRDDREEKSHLRMSVW
jgi:hypothetical protein